MSAKFPRRRVEELFERALDVPASEREEFVRVHETDASIVADVLGLLAGEDDSEGPIPKTPRPVSDGAHAARVIEALARHAPDASRYRVLERIGAGGQGAVYRVRDEALRRDLAMKVVRDDPAFESNGRTSPYVDSRSLSRFLEEAQITGQLEHPGIVPVHELGVDDRGSAFFTMRLVEGRTFSRVLDELKSGSDEWSVTRLIGMLLRASEAVAFAHDREVIHRDIKPGNLMVGRYGEVYVMDWGLARVLDGDEAPASHGAAAHAFERPATLRQDDESDALRTMDGDALGTPHYMAPEQARGEIDRVGPQADVYSLGATLYHVLAGSAPYSESRDANRIDVWERVKRESPAPVARLASDASPEVVAICQKAMARDLDDRYSSVADFAEDLRAFLEGRVVRAYRTGPLIELSKWVRRNRAMAATLGGLALVLVASGLVAAALERSRLRAQAATVDRRAAIACLAELERSWPIHPASVPSMQAWIATAESLVGRRGQHEADLEALERSLGDAERVPTSEDSALDAELAEVRYRLGVYGGGLPVLVDKLASLAGGTDADPEEIARREREIGVIEGELGVLEEREVALSSLLRDRRDWSYSDPWAERDFASLDLTLRALRRFEDPIAGIASVEALLERATGLRAESIDANGAAWDRAIASIREECPIYGGLVLEPQLGLVPLRRNPASGLWEFWHVLSGERPIESGNGYRLEANSGIVLILVPGGKFAMGAPESDPDAPLTELPQHDVELTACFLSRYEMTQAQWYRLTGDEPSEWYAPSGYTGNPRIERVNPVESVSWSECNEALPRWSLRMPTEAQWEFACRAGSSGRFGVGDSVDDLDERVNAYRGESDPDGHRLHGRVDAFPSNAWGFEAMLGNVLEWTRDWSAPNAPYAVEHIDPRTGEHFPPRSWWKSARGGGARNEPLSLRVTNRWSYLPDQNDCDIGVRPSRALDL
ncbi:MAG: SUMF1/EgtB/PvdO family nonheme iron enzyme [Planctomycetota bacterium]